MQLSRWAGETKPYPSEHSRLEPAQHEPQRQYLRSAPPEAQALPDWRSEPGVPIAVPAGSMCSTRNAQGGSITRRTTLICAANRVQHGTADSAQVGGLVRVPLCLADYSM